MAADELRNNKRRSSRRTSTWSDISLPFLRPAMELRVGDKVRSSHSTPTHNHVCNHVCNHTLYNQMNNHTYNHMNNHMQPRTTAYNHMQPHTTPPHFN